MIGVILLAVVLQIASVIGHALEHMLLTAKNELIAAHEEHAEALKRRVAAGDSFIEALRDCVSLRDAEIDVLTNRVSAVPQAVNEMVEQFRRTGFDAWPEHFTCDEADAFAAVLIAGGFEYEASTFLAFHHEGDTAEGDKHGGPEYDNDNFVWGSRVQTVACLACHDLDCETCYGGLCCCKHDGAV